VQLALVIALISLVAQSLPAPNLESMAGSIDLQRGSLTGQVSLERGNVSVQASLPDSGLEGQMALVVPSQFGLTLGTSSGAVSNFSVCGVIGPQEVTVSGARGGGLHLDFRKPQDDASACVPASSAATSATFMAPEIFAQASPPATNSEALTDLEDLLRHFLVMVVLSLGMWLFAPDLPTSVVATGRIRPWSRLGIGLSLLIALPVLGVATFVVGLPVGLWWLGLLLLMIFACVFAVSLAMTGLIIGAWLLHTPRGRGLPTLIGLGIGLLLLSALGVLPVVGSLVNVVAAIYGAGAVAMLPRVNRSDASETSPPPPLTDITDGVPSATAPVS
jgi:hypothetical protein